MVSDPTKRADRQHLLSSITQQLEVDQRVRAVWLAGSLGRGNPDDLSVIDLWMSVSDDLITEVIAEPEAWVRSRCDASLAFSIPRNGPPDGAYVFSLIWCLHGLQQVDWYWSPSATARRRSNTKVVFEREPVCLAEPPPGLSDNACQELAILWCRETLGMAHIAVKGIRRGDPWVTTRHLQMVADCAGAARFVQQHRREPEHDDPRDVHLPGDWPADAADQFRILGDLLTVLDPVLATLPEKIRAELIDTRQAIRDSIERHIDT